MWTKITMFSCLRQITPLTAYLSIDLYTYILMNCSYIVYTIYRDRSNGGSVIYSRCGLSVRLVWPRVPKWVVCWRGAERLPPEYTVVGMPELFGGGGRTRLSLTTLQWHFADSSHCGTSIVTRYCGLIGRTQVSRAGDRGFESMFESNQWLIKLPLVAS